MSHTLSLYRLQQSDSQIDHAQARLQAIKIKLEDDADLQLAKEQAALKKSICQSAERALQQAETDARNQQIKIEQTEASLYGSKVHSPKELIDLQNDVAALKRHLIKLEDIQLEAMLAVEETAAVYQVSDLTLQSAQNRSLELNRDLQIEQATLQKELEKLFAERAAISNPIPPDVLGLYDQLRLRGRGIAVAVIFEKCCSACGAGLSAAQMQSSRASGQIALCPSCGRILYGS
jgi:uncharacterized protein